MSNKDVNVILPAYNEEEIIGKVIEQLHNVISKTTVSFMIHVYNDGSNDNTLKVITDAIDKNRFTNVIVRTHKILGMGQLF